MKSKIDIDSADTDTESLDTILEDSYMNDMTDDDDPSSTNYDSYPEMNILNVKMESKNDFEKRKLLHMAQENSIDLPLIDSTDDATSTYESSTPHNFKILKRALDELIETSNTKESDKDITKGYVHVDSKESSHPHLVSSDIHNSHLHSVELQERSIINRISDDTKVVFDDRNSYIASPAITNKYVDKFSKIDQQKSQIIHMQHPKSMVSRRLGRKCNNRRNLAIGVACKTDKSPNTPAPKRNPGPSPTRKPTRPPTLKPNTSKPTGQPTSQPTGQPTSQPTSHPTPNITRHLDKMWTIIEAPIVGSALGSNFLFGILVSMSADGRTIVASGVGDDENNSSGGYAKVFSHSEDTKDWVQLGNTIKFTGIYELSSLSMSDDGRTIAVGASYNDGNGIDSGHVRIFFLHNSTWTQRGDTIIGAEEDDELGYSVAMSENGETIAVRAKCTYNKKNGYVKIFSYNITAKSWTLFGNIEGSAPSHDFGQSVSMSADGRTVVIGGRGDDDENPSGGYAKVYSFSEDTKAWNQLGNTIKATGKDDEFGFSVSMSDDGRTIAVGAIYNDDNGIKSGHVRIFSYAEMTNTWTQMGNTIVGEAEGDRFGWSVSLSANGTTVTAGAIYGGDHHSGTVRTFSHHSSTNEWKQVSNSIAGARFQDFFGYTVSMSADGTIFAAGAPLNDDNGSNKGHVRIFLLQPVMLAKESGACVGQFNLPPPVIERITLSRESFGPSLERQNACKDLCIDYMMKHGGTSCEAVWSESSCSEKNGCYLHSSPVVRGDNINSHTCWILQPKVNIPFKPHELGRCQNATDEETTRSEDKTLLGEVDNNRLCLSKCKHNYEQNTIKYKISGCEYDEDSKLCHIYDKPHWKAVKGSYKYYNTNKTSHVQCWLKAKQCLLDDDCDDNNHCTVDSCNTLTHECSNKYSFTNCRSYGEPKSLAIRVKANDSNNSMSLDKIESTIFGSSEAAFSVQSQLKSCSYNEFKPIPYVKKTSSGQNITNGVAEVYLDMNIKGQHSGKVQNIVIKAVIDTFGNISDEVDLLLLFLPHGTVTANTTNWKAYAYLNDWISVYNDNSTYTSIIMHEIGHNIGLLHSHDEVSYGDGSCVMGLSSEDTPHLCFNSAKSWQLGWYHDTQLILNAEDLSDGLDKGPYNLISIVEYDIARKKDYTAIKIAKCANKFDYYISFNRNVGITSSNTEGDNAVLVTRVPMSGYENSYLVARLGKNEEYTTRAFMDGTLLVVKYWFLYESSPVHTQVVIGRYHCKEDYDCNDFDPCTTDKCDLTDKLVERSGGICKFIPVNCNECGTLVNVTYSTNEFPNDFSWRIENADINRITMASRAKLNPNTTNHTEKCLAFGNYKFVVSYTKNETSSSNVTYSLNASNVLIFNGTANDYIDLEHDFTVCKSDENCFDFDGCTTDVCNPETKTCKNVVLDKTECSKCNMITVKLITDNYSEETSWNIASKIGAQDVSILSGHPYLSNALSDGRQRRKKNGPKAPRNGREKKKNAPKAPPNGREKKNGRQNRNLQHENYQMNTGDLLSDLFIGCFGDQTTRDLPWYKGNITTDDCLDACRNQGFKYASRQKDNECWCGNEVGSYGRAAGCNDCLSQTGYYGNLVNCVFMTTSLIHSFGIAQDGFCVESNGSNERPTQNKKSLDLVANHQDCLAKCNSYYKDNNYEPISGCEYNFKTNECIIYNLDSYIAFSGSGSHEEDGTCWILNEEIEETICLEKEYKYSFSISDSFGDGMCCKEGRGSYAVKVGSFAIAEGGDFGESENLWFKYQECNENSDCNDGDYSTTHSCKQEVAMCIYVPKACNEYGEMVYVNVTTYKFPESSEWVIEDLQGKVQYEKGGPYEISDRTYNSTKCLANGVYQVNNTGTVVIRIKLGIGNKVLFDEELESGKVKEFDTSPRLPSFPSLSKLPTFAPSTSVPFLSKLPTFAPSRQISNKPSLTPSSGLSDRPKISLLPTHATVTPTNHISCESYEKKLHIVVQTDSKAKWSNRFVIQQRVQSNWKIIENIKELPNNGIFSYSKCLNKYVCYRMKFIDKKGDGICCQNGHGWYNIFWKGDKIPHDPFTDGKEQILMFGSC